MNKKKTRIKAKKNQINNAFLFLLAIAYSTKWIGKGSRLRSSPNLLFRFRRPFPFGRGRRELWTADSSAKKRKRVRRRVFLFYNVLYMFSLPRSSALYLWSDPGVYRGRWRSSAIGHTIRLYTFDRFFFYSIFSKSIYYYRSFFLYSCSPRAPVHILRAQSRRYLCYPARSLDTTNVYRVLPRGGGVRYPARFKQYESRPDRRRARECTRYE